MPIGAGAAGSYGVGQTREGLMPGKTPQKDSAKKTGKSLKEKRDVKKAKKADRKAMPS